MRKSLSRIDKAHFFYLFVILALFGIFCALAYLNVTVKKQISTINLLPAPFMYSPQKYPKINNTYFPYVTAQGMVVIDNNSKVSLISKNDNLIFPPASTTKIMTALVALDYYGSTDILTIKNANVEGAMMGFFNGEKFTFDDLLYAMLLPSSNEAALAIAQNYPGGESAFVAKMNEKANALGLSKTHFADPVGLEDHGDYSTPRELALLSAEALKKPTFARVVATKFRQIKSIEGNVYTLNNLNILLNYPGVNGVKTGHTEGAGDVLVTSRKINGGDLIFAIMQSQDRFLDTQILLDYLNNNITYQTIHP
jgi:D-alanyl-D-alanine carboxypeptidase